MPKAFSVRIWQQLVSYVFWTAEFKSACCQALFLILTVEYAIFQDGHRKYIFDYKFTSNCHRSIIYGSISRLSYMTSKWKHFQSSILNNYKGERHFSRWPPKIHFDYKFTSNCHRSMIYGSICRFSYMTKTMETHSKLFFEWLLRCRPFSKMAVKYTLLTVFLYLIVIEARSMTLFAGFHAWPVHWRKSHSFILHCFVFMAQTLCTRFFNSI